MLDYPKGTHGYQNVSEALANSCNYFFYEMGYRLEHSMAHPMTAKLQLVLIKWKKICTKLGKHEIRC